jgi:(p)ppGpp synthase/HD superfamily hydrolase
VSDSEHDRGRLGRALDVAADLHRGQVRKGSSIPYLSHLMAVAALVMEDGGDEDQVVAALLHDAAEDQGGEATLLHIEQQFGSRVAEMVRDCSDSLVDRGTEKAPWHERKQAALAKLASVGSDSLVVIAADKLHNVQSTVADLRLLGEPVWTRFKTGRDGFLWYHREMAERLFDLAPESRSVQELRHEVDQLGGG